MCKAYFIFIYIMLTSLFYTLKSTEPPCFLVGWLRVTRSWKSPLPSLRPVVVKIEVGLLYFCGHWGTCQWGCAALEFSHSGFNDVLFSSRSLPEMIQFDEHSFQICWFNHQLDEFWRRNSRGFEVEDLKKTDDDKNGWKHMYIRIACPKGKLQKTTGKVPLRFQSNYQLFRIQVLC